MANFAPGGSFLPNADYLLTGTIVAAGQLEPVVPLAVDSAMPIAARSSS